MSKYQQDLKLLGHLFKDLRLKRGWTLEETEDHGWHDWKYLQKIENGQNITLSTFFKLCHLYGISSKGLLKNLESYFGLAAPFVGNSGKLPEAR